jgi:hypothetical protein
MSFTVESIVDDITGVGIQPPSEQEGSTRGTGHIGDEDDGYEGEGSGQVEVKPFVPPPTTTTTAPPPPPTTATTTTAPPPAQTGATRATPPADEGDLEAEGGGSLTTAAVGSGEEGDIARTGTQAQPTITVTVSPRPPLPWTGALRGAGPEDEGEDYEAEGSGQLPVTAWRRG